MDARREPSGTVVRDASADPDRLPGRPLHLSERVRVQLGGYVVRGAGDVPTGFAKPASATLASTAITAAASFPARGSRDASGVHGAARGAEPSLLLQLTVHSSCV